MPKILINLNGRTPEAVEEKLQQEFASHGIQWMALMPAEGASGAPKLVWQEDRAKAFQAASAGAGREWVLKAIEASGAIAASEIIPDNPGVSDAIRELYGRGPGGGGRSA